MDHDTTTCDPACTSDVPNWHLTIAYDGSNYRGWQIQPNAPTVQAEVQTRIRRLFRAPELRLAATSRTDAGVHALDQHVSFAARAPGQSTPSHIRTVLNRWLPEDITVLDVTHAPPDFHARHSACGKTYVYVLNAAEKCHPLFARFLWHYSRALDVAAMQAAAELLVGEHDFASFAVNPRREVASTVRTLHRVEVAAVDGLVTVCVTGNSFLYKMVRSIVGFLVRVGRGASKPGDVAAVLNARNRCAAAESAPGKGLFLARVFFEENAWQNYQPPLPPFAWHEGGVDSKAPRALQ